MRHTLLSLAAVATIATAASAQNSVPSSGVEFRTFAGGYVPTGTQRDDFKTASMFGLQLAREQSDHLHLLASATWADGRSKHATISQKRTNIWQYDAGIEYNLIREMGSGWFIRPLVGVGGGARTYDYQGTGVASKTWAAGYGNVGSEFQKGVIALRVDARGYVSRFEAPVSARNETRKDLGVTFGIVYHVR